MRIICLIATRHADDPHHIIGHGLGGMGTKADDVMRIICMTCGNQADDPHHIFVPIPPSP
ncbi:hypothetical protein PSZ77_24010, partial [Shigella sonnei]|nr:hypothetical protein [Shigella sonnei]